MLFRSVEIEDDAIGILEDEVTPGHGAREIEHEAHVIRRRVQAHLLHVRGAGAGAQQGQEQQERTTGPARAGPARRTVVARQDLVAHGQETGGRPAR